MTPNIKSVRKPEKTEDWLALRKPYLGGSEIAAVLGLSPWKTPVQLFLEKTGRLKDEPSNAEALRLGQYLEAYAAMRYQEETGLTVRNYNFMLVDEEAGLCGDVDRLVVPDGEKVAAHQGEIRTDALLECKTSGVAWDDGVPAYYEAQVQQYLWLTGCRRADFAVVFLAPRREFKMFSVQRDDEVIAAMRREAMKFRAKYIDTDTPPPAVCEADCKALWARSRGIEIEASPEIAIAIEELRSVESTIKGLEERESEIKAEVMAVLGEADTLVRGGQKLCTWKSSKDRDVTDWKAAFEELARTEEPSHIASIVARHTETKPGNRVFRVAK